MTLRSRIAVSGGSNIAAAQPGRLLLMLPFGEDDDISQGVPSEEAGVYA